MINQAPIVRYTASVCEIFFSDFRKKTFSAESVMILAPEPNDRSVSLQDLNLTVSPATIGPSTDLRTGHVENFEPLRPLTSAAPME
jgi:hypothetical protein